MPVRRVARNLRVKPVRAKPVKNASSKREPVFPKHAVSAKHSVSVHHVATPHEHSVRIVFSGNWVGQLFIMLSLVIIAGLALLVFNPSFAPHATPTTLPVTPTPAILPAPVSMPTPTPAATSTAIVEPTPVATSTAIVEPTPAATPTPTAQLTPNAIPLPTSIPSPTPVPDVFAGYVQIPFSSFIAQCSGNSILVGGLKRLDVMDNGSTFKQFVVESSQNFVPISNYPPQNRPERVDALGFTKYYFYGYAVPRPLSQYACWMFVEKMVELPAVEATPQVSLPTPQATSSAWPAFVAKNITLAIGQDYTDDSGRFFLQYFAFNNSAVAFRLNGLPYSKPVSSSQGFAYSDGKNYSITVVSGDATTASFTVYPQ